MHVIEMVISDTSCNKLGVLSVCAGSCYICPLNSLIFSGRRVVTGEGHIKALALQISEIHLSHFPSRHSLFLLLIAARDTV